MSYTCSILAYFAHLLFLVPPSAPYLHVEERTLSTITLKWNPSDSGGAPIRMWNVWWRLSSRSGAWKTKELSRLYSKHTIKDLQCGSEYQASEK